MHRICLDRKNVFVQLKKGLQTAAHFMGKYAGQFGYYACVGLVLAAVAVAAQRYRGGEGAEELVLPAAEIAVPAPVKEEVMFATTEGMEVLRAYSGQPEWNSDLGLWESHTAVDFACRDEAVYSLSEGIVRTVGKSGLYGGFVEVQAEEYTLLYASISPDEKLMPGTELKKGDSIGTADTSRPGEAYMGAHLHIELYRNGECLDFAKESGKKLP